MSSGHYGHGEEEPVLNMQALDRILKKQEVRERLYHYYQEDNEHDLPYLAGYDDDGDTIYYDRHLPQRLEVEMDGRKKEFDPREFLRRHESMECCLVQCCGYGYWPAHAAANAWERRGVLERLGPGMWPFYCGAIDPYIKAAEMERIKKVPSDLDMTPYYAEPVNKGLIAVMQKAMGAERKHSKEEVEYGEGRPSAHCGPVKEWGGGDCKNFERPAACSLVRGHIGSRMWCKLWASKERS